MKISSSFLSLFILKIEGKAKCYKSTTTKNKESGIFLCSDFETFQSSENDFEKNVNDKKNLSLIVKYLKFNAVSSALT